MNNKKIKTIMKNKNLTFYKLGLLIGVTPQAAGNWNARGVPAKHALKVADILGVSVEELLQ